MLARHTVSVSKLFPSGYYECAAIVNGYRVSMVYGGYTKREALKLFRAAIRKLTQGAAHA